MNSKLNLYENTHFIICTKTQYILALDAPFFSYLIYRAITDDAFSK